METLTVLPRLGKLTHVWAARRLEAIAGTDRRRRRPGTEGDFYGVREWRRGDGRRLIHWRSSARQGKLVVRQFERPQSRDAAVVLDLWQPDGPSDADLRYRRTGRQLCGHGAGRLVPQRRVQRLSGTERSAAGEAGPHVIDSTNSTEDRAHPHGPGAHRDANGWSPDFLGGPASPAMLQGLMERLAVAEPHADDTLPAVLAYTLRRIATATEIVLVGTRPIDLTDTVAIRRAVVRSQCCANGCATSARWTPRVAEFSQYFQAE